MQSKILFWVIALFTLWGCSPQEKVTLYVDCNGESVKRELSFLRGGKKILTFYPEFQIGFMKFLQKSSDGNSFRTTFEFAESGDYKPFLLDLTGDGDERYLILTEWSGGNNAFGYRGYLIDTKDNFAIIGEVPAGKIGSVRYFAHLIYLFPLFTQRKAAVFPHCVK